MNLLYYLQIYLQGDAGGAAGAGMPGIRSYMTILVVMTVGGIAGVILARFPHALINTVTGPSGHKPAGTASARVAPHPIIAVAAPVLKGQSDGFAGCRYIQNALTDKGGLYLGREYGTPAPPVPGGA